MMKKTTLTFALLTSVSLLSACSESQYTPALGQQQVPPPGSYPASNNQPMQYPSPGQPLPGQVAQPGQPGQPGVQPPMSAQQQYMLSVYPFLNPATSCFPTVQTPAVQQCRSNRRRTKCKTIYVQKRVKVSSCNCYVTRNVEMTETEYTTYTRTQQRVESVDNTPVQFRLDESHTAHPNLAKMATYNQPATRPAATNAAGETILCPGVVSPSNNGVAANGTNVTKCETANAAQPATVVTPVTPASPANTNVSTTTAPVTTQPAANSQVLGTNTNVTRPTASQSQSAPQRTNTPGEPGFIGPVAPAAKPQAANAPGANAPAAAAPAANNAPSNIPNPLDGVAVAADADPQAKPQAPAELPAQYNYVVSRSEDKSKPNDAKEIYKRLAIKAQGGRKTGPNIECIDTNLVHGVGENVTCTFSIQLRDIPNPEDKNNPLKAIGDLLMKQNAKKGNPSTPVKSSPAYGKVANSFSGMDIAEGKAGARIFLADSDVSGKVKDPISPALLMDKLPGQAVPGFADDLNTIPAMVKTFKSLRCFTTTTLDVNQTKCYVRINVETGEALMADDNQH